MRHCASSPLCFEMHTSSLDGFHGRPRPRPRLGSGLSSGILPDTNARLPMVCSVYSMVFHQPPIHICWPLRNTRACMHACAASPPAIATLDSPTLCPRSPKPSQPSATPLARAYPPVFQELPCPGNCALKVPMASLWAPGVAWGSTAPTKDGANRIEVKKHATSRTRRLVRPASIPWPLRSAPGAGSLMRCSNSVPDSKRIQI